MNVEGQWPACCITAHYSPFGGKKPHKQTQTKNSPNNFPPSTALQRINKFKWILLLGGTEHAWLRQDEVSPWYLYKNAIPTIFSGSRNERAAEGIARGNCLWQVSVPAALPVPPRWGSVLRAAIGGSHTAATHLHKFSLGSKPPLIWDFCVQWNSGQVKNRP